MSEHESTASVRSVPLQEVLKSHSWTSMISQHDTVGSKSRLNHRDDRLNNPRENLGSRGDAVTL